MDKVRGWILTGVVFVMWRGQVFEAKHRGDDARITESTRGWEMDHSKASGHDTGPTGTGKWKGGGAGGIKAEVIKAEKPKGPPPPKDLKELVKATDSGNTGK